jgi:hypothetical protein
LAVIERTAGRVGEDAITASGVEGIELEVRVLICGGHTRVAKEVSHARFGAYQKRQARGVLRR